MYQLECFYEQTTLTTENHTWSLYLVYCISNVYISTQTLLYTYKQTTLTTENHTWPLYLVYCISNVYISTQTLLYTYNSANYITMYGHSCMHRSCFKPIVVI